jgi:hypothetical protein
MKSLSYIFSIILSIGVAYYWDNIVFFYGELDTLNVSALQTISSEGELQMVTTGFCARSQRIKPNCLMVGYAKDYR